MIIENVPFNTLLGLTFDRVVFYKKRDPSEERLYWNANNHILFDCTDGRRFVMTHLQACCEEVYLEDVCGDLEDLVGSPILFAEESINRKKDPGESQTWTFYHLRTQKGTVTLRWYGTSSECPSSGYYSEEAELYLVVTEK